MKYPILPALLFFSLAAFSQDCSKALLRKKPGVWKAGLQGSIHNVSAPELAREKTVLSVVHKMIQANYSPTGCQVLYSTVFGKYPLPGQTYIADPYYFAMYFLRYLCDENSADKSKSYVDISTPTTVNIAANAIYSLNALYAANIPSDDFRGYLKLEKWPQKKDGAWFMGEVVEGDRGLPSEIKEYKWLITYNDTLPFVYLSRKEYLLIQKKRMEQTIKDEGASAFYNQFLKNINDQLNKSEAELSKPAVCPWNDEERFTGFVAEGTAGSFIAVKPNLNYYHKKLPGSSPQFFTVVYKISAGDPVFEENMTNIKKAVDFTILKNMLGK
ncbi:MAG: hypothetical protein IPL84_17050 [Chitinophagaceae bacterium]|nr:hypothetical protein [Chitinophagaceae bacterium]